MSKRRFICFLILLSIEILLLMTGTGVFSYGALSVTILQIPVVLAAVCLGLPEGLVIGAVFGAGSMLLAANYGVETLDRLFVNPLVALLPRILIAVAAFYSCRLIKKVADDYTLSSDLIAGGIASLVGALTNTVCVTFMLCLLYPIRFGVSDSISSYAGILTNVIGTNTVLELFVTAVFAILFIPLLKPKNQNRQEERKRPLSKTFQKWLILCVAGAFLLTLLISYAVQTRQEWENSKRYTDIVLEDAVHDLHNGLVDETAAPYRIGVQGMLVITRNNQVINAVDKDMLGKNLSDAGLGNITQAEEFTMTALNGSTYYFKTLTEGEYQVIALLPETEIYGNRNATVVVLLIANIVVFMLVFLIISRLLRDNVVTQIYEVNGSLSDIQKGELGHIVEVRTSEEFSVLSDGINATVAALKESTEQIEAKIHEELEFARKIQLSVLPTEENVAAKRQDFEVVGSMYAAREVGGDFFDYFLIGEDKLGVVIADVSGKGIPSALFMMTAKTIIKNYALSGHSPAEVLAFANEQLCENNEAGMFVTVWFGILDYGACELTFANAGHNPPLLKHWDSEWEYLDHKKYKRSIMLGIREGIRYKDNRLPFIKGDVLYLYTDGVTEANNISGELYGEDRLKNYLAGCGTISPAELMESVKKDVDTFAGEKEQFDDITMVVLGMQAVREKRTFAVLHENTQEISDFIKGILTAGRCSEKLVHQMLIAVDEIYSNIVKYSDAKELELSCAVTLDNACLVFSDDGSPYNPLEQKEPDIHAAKEERPIGGLGIYMVKKTMDETGYQYQDNRNVFKIGKKLVQEEREN